MSKKILDTSGISNELAGASLFFSSPKQIEEPQSPATIPAQATVMPEKADIGTNPTSPPPSKGEFPLEQKKEINMDARKNASIHASMQANEITDGIESIRKVVKNVGKEVTYVRLLPEEKEKLANIVYTYKRLGVKTSENEIGRIAINFLAQDYEENGENSVLAKVLVALNA